MAYDEYLEERISRILNEKHVDFHPKKMMGGLCFMVDNKICLGIVKNEMNFTGRPMKGYVFLTPEAIDLEEDLEYWVQLCLDFNPRAKSSKKK